MWAHQQAVAGLAVHRPPVIRVPPAIFSLKCAPSSSLCITVRLCKSLCAIPQCAMFPRVCAATGLVLVYQGPKAILNTWRRRMQRLTSVTEQLKRKECRAVVTVLQSTFRAGTVNGAAPKVLDDTEDAVKQARFLLLRRWKELDAEITEAAVEAKVCVRVCGILAHQ